MEYNSSEYLRSAKNQNFYAGGDSLFGFLGEGENLEEVIAGDRDTLRRLGISAEQLGEKLKFVLDEIGSGTKGVIGNLEYSRVGYRGMQNCPFESCVYHGAQFANHSNSDYILTDTQGDLSIKIPGLIWHLIKDHEFFEGHESSYRVDPSDLHDILKNINY